MIFMLPWSVIWLAGLCVLGIAELATGKRFALFAMPAAIVSLVLSLFEVWVFVQCAVFVVLVAAGIVLRLLLARRKSSANEWHEMEDLIGQHGTVTSRIENLAGNGEVRIGEMYFAARAAEEERIYDIGSPVVVIAVEGVKLICK